MRIATRRLQRKVKCPVSGKRRYQSKLDCLIDMANNPRQIRAYRCDHCGDWHATSRLAGREAA